MLRCKAMVRGVGIRGWILHTGQGAGCSGVLVDGGRQGRGSESCRINGNARPTETRMPVVHDHLCSHLARGVIVDTTSAVGHIGQQQRERPGKPDPYVSISISMQICVSSAW